MSKVMEKYVAKALEGYESNHKAICEAIEQLGVQLEDFNGKKEEMEEGIAEMKEVLGLKEEGSDHGVVNDGTAVV